MLGKKIKERREALGLTQSQLAELIGVGSSAISNYENNTSAPKDTVLLKLFSALQCDANYLYSDFIHDGQIILDTPENSLIKKYRALDEHGKKIVNSVIDIEYEHCTGTSTILRAARSKDHHGIEIVETTKDFSKFPPKKDRI